MARTPSQTATTTSLAASLPATRPSRAVVEVVAPVVDGGRFAAKATVGEPVAVVADVFTDGHDHVDASLWVQRPDGDAWEEHPMVALGNDRWRGVFVPDALGRWRYRVSGWVAHYGTWRAATLIKQAAGLDLRVELLEGAAMLDELTGDANADAAAADFRRNQAGEWLLDADLEAHAREALSRDPEEVSPEYPIQVEVPQARFSVWYEFFPRSTVDSSTGHGTLADAIDRLPYVKAMGFDVLYLPPVHPIGRSYRKGPNNTFDPDADSGDYDGSPWAIGAVEGGHTAVHPDLGTVDDVAALAAAAKKHGISLALDIAFQSAPDHPWVKEHPDWFKQRPDGTIQYAENPPKKYQDIYPFHFESQEWSELWQALLDVVRFWVDKGVTVFRVDNPHTKPFAMWEWLIAELRTTHPEVILLAEAFTRPRVMERLAKLGYSQSYTYFAWRQSGWELREYFTDLSTRTVDYMRPNVWPNTPDILTEQMQHGGRPMFVSRAVLAATLAANWGVYGPAFELVQHTAVRQGSEEYLDSEKYQRRHWNLDQSHSLAPLLTRLNAIRGRHPALQSDRGLRFHPTDNDQLLCYSKREPEGTDVVLVVVNLDPYAPQSGWVDIDLAALGLPYEAIYTLRDELGDGVYQWQGAWNWVHLDPGGLPAHVFSVTPGAAV